MMFEDDDLIPISALQHLAYCPRQAALIHVERAWREDQNTAIGKVVHEHFDAGGNVHRGGVPVSHRLGVAGLADMLSFTLTWPRHAACARGQSKPRRAAPSTSATTRSSSARRRSRSKRCFARLAAQKGALAGGFADDERAREREGPPTWVLFRAELLATYQPNEDSLRFYFLDALSAARTEHHGAKQPLDPTKPLIV